MGFLIGGLGGRCAQELPVAVLGGVSAGGVGGLCQDGEVGDVADGCEGLAAEAEGGDGGQVLETGELRRGEPLADDGEVGAPDSRSVVADLDQLQAAVAEDDCELEIRVQNGDKTLHYMPCKYVNVLHAHLQTPYPDENDCSCYQSCLITPTMFILQNIEMYFDLRQKVVEGTISQCIYVYKKLRSHQ